MSFFTAIITDLREKRLLPVAAVLLVGLVAVPVLLAKPAGKVHLTALPPAPAGGAAPNAGLPAVNVISTQNKSILKARSRDPFKQPKGSGSTGATATTRATAVTPVGGSGTGNGTTTSGSGTTTTGTTTTSTTPTTTTPGGSTPPPPPITHPNPPPAPPGLTAEETYRVTVSVTNRSGGLDRIDSLERLAAFPSNAKPLLVELGVLDGGHRVVFAVRPGTAVRGPGSCTPGPIDCEILSLSTDQIESLLQRTPNGNVPVSQFAVTGISAQRYPSVAAAQKARNRASTIGRRLLASANLPALSLFQYKPGLGAVVDLRNLKVGGF